MRAAISLTFLGFLAACGGGGGGNTHTLTVTAAGPGGVSSAPAGIGCRGNSCSNGFAVGTAVTLTAHPDAGASFAGWTGACSGVTSTCQVTMSANVTVGATFAGPGAGSHSVTVTVT